jgi:NADH:ubiquinone oxidoreductase subunit K
MNPAATLQNYLVVGAILFGLGLIGFLARRNLSSCFCRPR